MSKPSFLIIGGMKCGTTTLYDDLADVSDIILAEKESVFFRREISALPENPMNGTLTGDCSTLYTMLPSSFGIAKETRLKADKDLKLVYMVRDPVKRALSHHHHLLARGTTTKPFKNAVVEFPEIITYGMYEEQSEPWTNQFGQDALLLIPLERYRSDDGASLRLILQHIGSRAKTDNLTTRHSNATNDVRVFRGASRLVVESRFGRFAYEQRKRSVFSPKFRAMIRSRLLPPPPEAVSPPSASVLTALSEEYVTTSSFVRCHTGHAWDLAATVQEIVNE